MNLPLTRLFESKGGVRQVLDPEPGIARRVNLMKDPPRISVIDDDASIRKSLARYLHLLGCEVETRASAEEYLAQETPCDCLIVDIHLPGMSGLELVSKLRESGHAVPVVFITANDLSEDDKAQIQSGAHLAMKPFDVEEFGETVMRVINEG